MPEQETIAPDAPVQEATAKVTVEDMYRMPRDGRKYELIKGEVKVAPAGMYHELVAAKLTIKLGVYLENHPIGQIYTSSVGFNLPSGDLLSPDVSFVSSDRLPSGKTPEGFGNFAPDLAIEIVSPGDSLTDIEDKVDLYLSNGARVVWVINPRSGRATIYRPDQRVQVIQADEALDGDDVLPGFSCALADVLGERPAR